MNTWQYDEINTVSGEAYVRRSRPTATEMLQRHHSRRTAYQRLVDDVRWGALQISLDDFERMKQELLKNASVHTPPWPFNPNVPSLPDPAMDPQPTDPRAKALEELKAQRIATRKAVYGDFRSPVDPIDPKPFDGADAIFGLRVSTTPAWVYR